MSGQVGSSRPRDLLPAFAWGALVFNILVILWGAVVRITGAGAGCGDHWPLCNGTVVPLDPTLHTVIEFSHRLTSGLSGLLAIGLVFLAFRRFPRGHAARLGAGLSLGLIVLEGLVGGVQVRLGLTADSTNPWRGLVQGVHLANTFALLGALLLTARWVSGAPRPRLRGQGGLLWASVLALIGMLVLGMLGAVTALGDLLYRPTGAPGLDTLRSDFSATATVLENLRVVHPVLGIVVSVGLIALASLGSRARPSGDTRRAKVVVHALVGAQILVGFLNVALKAPGWMQLTHLLLACLLWLATVLLTTALLSAPAPRPAVPGGEGVRA